MSLTNNQQDIVVDLYEQCMVVRTAHEQYQANQYDDGTKGGRAKRQSLQPTLKATYKKAVKDLCDLYKYAMDEGVHEDILEACTDKHLPKDITIMEGQVVLD